MTATRPKRTEAERRVYSTKRWRRLREQQLDAFPLCAYCQRIGRTVPADTVDHIVPHHGDDALLWDPLNLESLCTSCHQSAAHLKDLHGYAPGAGLDGEPLDPGHPWATGKPVSPAVARGIASILRDVRDYHEEIGYDEARA